MLQILAVTLPLLSPPGGADWTTYTIGSSYSLVEYGCQRKDDSVKVARSYHEKGQAEAWRLILSMGKRTSGDGRAMCMKIVGDFIFTSMPVLETEVDIGDATCEHLSVVHAHTAKGNSYWLLMLNSSFVRDE
jgi:hypothetical protein